MKLLVIAAAVGTLVFAASASGAASDVSWTLRDMKTAIRGIGYPKPRPKTLTCQKAAVTAFRCSATYKHHQRSRFYIQGTSLGGWLCAGKTVAGCKLLKHGFATNGQVSFYGSTAGVAELAARGVMQTRYGASSVVVVSPCASTGALSWSCSYGIAAGTVVVTILLKRAPGGYVLIGGSQLSS